jgi:hypothetical protein
MVISGVGLVVIGWFYTSKLVPFFTKASQDEK